MAQTYIHPGRKPNPAREAGKTINGVHYFPLSKQLREPQDYIPVPVKDNSHLAGHWSRSRRYPWTEKIAMGPDYWEDGSWWNITEGEDYWVDTPTMLRYLHVHCWRKGLRVNAYRMPDNKNIRFQIYTGLPRYLNLRDHGVHWRDQQT